MFLEYIALCFFSSPKQFQWKLKITCLDLSSVQDQARSIIEVKKSFRYLKIAIWITFSNIPTRIHWYVWTNKVHTPTFIQMYRKLIKDFNFSPFLDSLICLLTCVDFHCPQCVCKHWFYRVWIRLDSSLFELLSHQVFLWISGQMDSILTRQTKIKNRRISSLAFVFLNDH